MGAEFTPGLVAAQARRDASAASSLLTIPCAELQSPGLAGQGEGLLGANTAPSAGMSGAVTA